MKKAIGALALFLLVALGLSTPAYAEVTDDCHSVPVNLTDRPDNGSHGVWATDTMTRTLKVCATDEKEGIEPGVTWWYSATVTDEGTFETVAGKSPHDGVDLKAGIEGTVKGGFRAHFLAQRAFGDWTPDALNQDTPTGQWVKAVMPSAEGTLVGSYRWTYTTACETYTDNNDVYSGDITSRCVTPKVPTHTPPTCNKTGTVDLPKQEGVTYTPKRNVENGVTVSATVTATPGEGYAFPKDATTTWTYPVALLTGKVCESPSPSPTHPTPSPSKSTQSPGTTPTHTGAPTDPVDPSTSTSTASGELPVTGPSSPIGVLAAGGVLILSGVGMLVGLRMRRKAIEG